MNRNFQSFFGTSQFTHMLLWKVAKVSGCPTPHAPHDFEAKSRALSGAQSKAQKGEVFD